jgi:acyl carrier protein
MLKALYESKRARPFFDEVGRAAAANTRHVVPVTEAIVEVLERARPADRRAILLAHIREQAAEVLGLQVKQVDPKRGLFDLGMDSLMSVELKTRLENTLGEKLPSTLTFNYPTVGAITDYIAGTVLALDSPSSTPVPVETASPADGDDLSEDELVSLLAAQLGKMSS